MHPFNPQPIEQLRERFPIALRTIYDWESGFRLTAAGPGIVNPEAYKEGPPSENVFDFGDGLRLIVTLDREGTDVFLHISAGAQPGSAVMKKFMFSGRGGQAVFKDLVTRRFKEVSGDREPLEFNGFAKPSGVGHWRRRLR